MKDKFKIKITKAHLQIISNHLDEIIKYYGTAYKAYKVLKLTPPSFWLWKSGRQAIEPKHAVYICNRCEIADFEKLIPHYEGWFIRSYMHKMQ